MNSTRNSKSTGFGLQRDITEDGAVIHLRITNPRRLNMKLLGEVLVRYFQGGYKTLILDQGPYSKKKMNLVEFLGRLQAMCNERRYLFLESKLI